jgi:hypothetical protein
MKGSMTRSKRFLVSLLVAGAVLVPVSYSPSEGFTVTDGCADANCCGELKSICDGVLINYYYSLRGCRSKLDHTTDK